MKTNTLIRQINVGRKIADASARASVRLFRNRLQRKYNIEADEPIPDDVSELIERLHRLRQSNGRGAL